MQLKKISMCAMALCLLISGHCLAATDEQNKNVTIYYDVQDSILRAQNKEGDIERGKKELEEDIKEYYSKRFNVKQIKPLPEGIAYDEIPNSIIGMAEHPFIINLSLNGTDVRTDYYQNAFGAQTVGYARAINVHLIETSQDTEDNKFYSYDYGDIAYSKGTFTVGMVAYEVDSNPRTQVKDAVKGMMRDACKFNENNINEYVNPKQYEDEVNRYKGNFKPMAIENEKKNAISMQRIQKMEEWLMAHPELGSILPTFETFSTEQKLSFIDNMKNTGLYVEN